MAAQKIPSYLLQTRSFVSKKGTQCYTIVVLVLNKFRVWESHEKFVDGTSDVWKDSQEIPIGSAVDLTWTIGGDLVSIFPADGFERLPLPPVL